MTMTPEHTARFELYEAFGVFEAKPHWPFNTPTRRRVRSLDEPFTEAELTDDISLIDLTLATAEDGVRGEVKVYGDDITGAFVRVVGTDRRAVDRAYDRLLERMPRVIEAVGEAFGS